jgi:K+-transporting ATPase ATPase C chain
MKAMMKELRRGVLYTTVTMVLFGGVYHLLIWGIGRVAFPRQAEGSLLRRSDGTVIGSTLIAQKFTSPGYFQPRPSAVDYNAASTGASNHGPSNPEHLKVVGDRLKALTNQESVVPGIVPAEMVTTSGSGLDPHVPPAAADLQVARVAHARHLSPERVREMVRAHIQPPALGIFGRARVNVLELNQALDLAFPQVAR